MSYTKPELQKCVDAMNVCTAMMRRCYTAMARCEETIEKCNVLLEKYMENQDIQGGESRFAAYAARMKSSSNRYQ